MLKIEIVAGGVVLIDPIQITQRTGQGGRAVFTLSFSVTEDDPFLSQKLVAASVNWGDGSLPVDYPVTPSPITVITTKDFPPGFYIIRVNANNFRLPTHDTQQAIIQLTILGEPQPVKPSPITFGPILPRDQGFPNRDQWLLNSGEDLGILESSIRMLLLTGKGERLMEPQYGTNIRSILFTNDFPSAKVFIEQEIVNALSQWEPRVVLSKFAMNKQGSTATVNAEFVSRLSQQPFQINLSFALP